MNEYCGWAKLGRDINVSIQRGAIRVGPGVLKSLQIVRKRLLDEAYSSRRYRVI